MVTNLVFSCFEILLQIGRQCYKIVAILLISQYKSLGKGLNGSTVG